MERPKTTHTRGVFRYLKDVRRPCCPELCRARCVVRDRNGTPSAPHKRCVFLSFSLLVSNGRDPDHQTTLLPRMQPTIVRPFSPRTPARHLVLVLLTSTLVSTITGTPPASRTICRRKDTKSERTTRKGANRYIRQGVGEGIDKTGASDGARSRTAHGIYVERVYHTTLEEEPHSSRYVCGFGQQPSALDSTCHIHWTTINCSRVVRRVQGEACG